MRAVNILGMGPSVASFSASQFPGEVWGINYSYLYTEKLDRLFMFHNWGRYINDAVKPGRRSKYFLREIKENILQFWTIHKLQVAVPRGTPFVDGEDVDMVFSNPGEIIDWNEEDNPEDYELLIDSHCVDKNELIKQFGAEYFTCSLPYLIGQAVIEGYDLIILHGIDIWDFGGNTTYGNQVPCVNAWCHWARNRGVQILVPWLNAMMTSDRIFTKCQPETDLIS